MFNQEMHTLLNVVPNNKHSLFKNLLSNAKSLTLEDNRDKQWLYNKEWDIIFYDKKDTFVWKAEDFKEYLSDNMYVFEDIVIFVEWKGVHGYFHPKVSLLSLPKGSVRINRGA